MTYLPLRKLLEVYFVREGLQEACDKIDEPVSPNNPELIDTILREWERHGKNKYDLIKILPTPEIRRICKKYGIDSKGKEKELIKRIKKARLLDPDSPSTVKTHRIGNIIVIGLIVAIGFSATFVFFNGVTPTKTITFTPTGGFITQQNPDFPPDIDMKVIFKTTVLSAQNPIEVEAKMIPSEYFYLYDPDPWPYLPSKQYLLFPGALKYPQKTFPEGDFVAGYVELQKSDEPREYHGNGKIIYQTSGDYGFLFVGPKFMDEHATETAVATTLNELKERISEHTLFHVDPDQSAILNTGKYSVTVGLIGFAISIFKYRDKITHMISR